MRFEINSDRIRRWRLRLAQLVAPAGADVRDPDDILWPYDQDVLEAVLYSQLRRVDGKEWMDVTLTVDEAYARDLVQKNSYGQWWLTGTGEQELARIWGDDRIPPWSGGYRDCLEHGIYDAHPGELSGCPSCRTEQAARNVNTEAASWWPRRRWGRASR